VDNDSQLKRETETKGETETFELAARVRMFNKAGKLATTRIKSGTEIPLK
jgi:hypothetical protein